MKIISKKITFKVFLFVLAIFSVVASAYMNIEVLNKMELNNLSCGWPMQYLSSGYYESKLDPPYPWTANCMSLVSGEWGDPVSIQWINLIVNVIFFYLFLSVLFYGGRIIAKKT